MSQTSSGSADQQQQQQDSVQILQNLASYVPTEEEKRVFRECSQESFWYRSMPCAAVAVGITQVLVSKGALTPSPRFGALPKVIFAALFGYSFGKISYNKTCQEKFRNLENSPLGEALRRGEQRGRPPHQQQSAPLSQSEMGDPNQMTFDPALQSATEPPYSGDSFGYSGDVSTAATYQPATFNESGAGGDYAYNNPQEEEASYLDEEKPRRKAIMYEDLRSKNREHYEVAMTTQKADTTVLKPPAEAPAPRKHVNQNQYGDTWE